MPRIWNILKYIFANEFQYIFGNARTYLIKVPIDSFGKFDNKMIRIV